MNDDHAAAMVFRALSEPATLALLLHALSADRHEIRVGMQVGTPSQDVSRLAGLVDAGLMTRASEGALEVYRVSDAALLELLLRTARRLDIDRRAR